MPTTLPQLDLCYLKDAAKLRRYKKELENYNLNSVKDFIRKKNAENIDIYFWSFQQQKGYFYFSHPLEQNSWAILYDDEKGNITQELLQKIIAILFRESIGLYRIDSYLLRKDDSELQDSIDYEIICGEFDSDQAFIKRSFFSPQFSQRQIAFITWRFGYLVLVTDKERKKISRISFVRENTKLEGIVRSFAHYYCLFDSKTMIEDKDQEPQLLAPAADLPPHSDIIKQAAQEIIEYLESNRKVLDFPIAIEEGTDFQRQVWEITDQIPYGHVLSYLDLAEEITEEGENPVLYARPVGQALGANPLPLRIPCHRIIGKNRELIGFTGGVDIKDYLLNMEILKFKD